MKTCSMSKILKISTMCILLAMLMLPTMALADINTDNKSNISGNISSNTSKEEFGWPDLRVTYKYITPPKIRPGNDGTLYLTVSEVGGADWAKDVTIFAEIVNPDGTSFSETGTNHLERSAGNIGAGSSFSTNFGIKTADYATIGDRTVKITVRWYETGGFNWFTYGPYYVDAYIDFTVAGIKVTSPNGGENLQRDTTNSVTWDNHIDSSYVKIELLKGGALDSTISSSTVNDGSIDWYIPSSKPTGNDYKIRIIGISDPTYNDNSDNTFTISSPSSITVTTPNGGENWARGTTKRIQWSPTGNPGSNVKIDLLKGGVLDSVLTYNTLNDGAFDWVILSTQALGNDYKVRITSTSNSAYTDTSNNNFIIGASSSITVVTPNGGESWTRGTSKTITWTKTGSPGANVKVELLKGGTVNRIIFASTPNDGSQTWAIPTTQTLGTDYKIRVTSLSYPTIKDTSNNNFAISGSSPPYIRVISPNGGESWARGSTKLITWTYGGSPGANVRIQLYKGGSLVRTISSGTPNDGSFSWPIPWTQAIGSDYKIKISSTTTSYNDWSNSNFRIY